VLCFDFNKSHPVDRAVRLWLLVPLRQGKIQLPAFQIGSRNFDSEWLSQTVTLFFSFAD
jgi:hypothetical protein